MTDNITTNDLFRHWVVMPSNLEGLDYPADPPTLGVGLRNLSPDPSVPVGGGNLSAPLELESIEQAIRVASVRSQSEGLDPSLSRRLIEISSLLPGWDGYNSPSIAMDAIETGIQLLLAMFIFGQGHLPIPFVAPLPDGGLELEWEIEPEKELMIIISSSGREVEYLFNQGLAEESGNISDDQSIKTLIDRLLF